MAKEPDRKKPGPPADHLAIKGPWEGAVKKALEKPPARKSDQSPEPEQDESPEKDGG